MEGFQEFTKLMGIQFQNLAVQGKNKTWDIIKDNKMYDLFNLMCL